MGNRQHKHRKPRLAGLSSPFDSFPDPVPHLSVEDQLRQRLLERQRARATRQAGVLQEKTPKPKPRNRRRRPTAQPLLPGKVWRRRLRNLGLAALLLPLAGVGLLILIAPPLPSPQEALDQQNRLTGNGERPVGVPFSVDLTGEHFYSLDFDPRQVQFGLMRGWDREPDAYTDREALAFVSGPMYERYYLPNPRLERALDLAVQPSSPERASDQGFTVPLGDMKFGNEIWRGINRAAAGQRAFIAIDHAGAVTFGYGELSAERARTYDTFIGGLHVLYNDLKVTQPGYRGAYSDSLGQKIRYYLPRIRMVFGLRPDHRLEILMSKDGLTLEETKELSRKRGLLAAYLPDHASRSRFIIPGRKGFSAEDANWISGGSVSYVHVPYMLRLSSRQQPILPVAADPLRRPPVAAARPMGPVERLNSRVAWAADRSLSGLNRLVEGGLVPLARLVWPVDTNVGDDRAPLPEPPITADPPTTRQAPLPATRWQPQHPQTAATQDHRDRRQPLADQPQPAQPPASAADTTDTALAPQPEPWSDLPPPILLPPDPDPAFWDEELQPLFDVIAEPPPLPDTSLLAPRALPQLPGAAGGQGRSDRALQAPPRLDRGTGVPMPPLPNASGFLDNN